MLDVLARRHCLTLDPSLREQLIARCEGVPLYLQEICRWLEIDRREGCTLDAAALPRGLLGLLASRIDQLHQDRSVAHMAAVCGRQFETALLRACLDTTDAALRAALEQMRRLEIIEPCEAAPFDFQFTHPLLHEAAYLSCPQDVRVTLHGRLVGLIESQRPAWISRHPAISPSICSAAGTRGAAHATSRWRLAAPCAPAPIVPHCAWPRRVLPVWRVYRVARRSGGSAC
nr:hypothetical protein [Salinicola tamaricis]